ncbi:hypothetical protein RFW50_04345, partial [Acinetobacter baumannii]|nr:hypothetical protein [Acinetobacter baumannii]
QTEQGLEFREPYQRCVDDGFPNGYLVTMATPELSFHGLLGARFFTLNLVSSFGFLVVLTGGRRCTSSLEIT